MKLVMLAVVGLSPQVVTEAVYGLAAEGRGVDEIHLITTRGGRDEIMKHLLAPGDGRLAALCREYGIRLPDCGPHTLHVLRDDSGSEIDDIAGQEDNENLLSLCLELAWKHTGREDCAVCFLVAGGRKTMTSCLTLAAQLYGRRRDRIYHVLVTPEFESCRDFWYPPKKSVPLRLRDNRGQEYIKDTRYARVNLVPVPFVSLRDRIDHNLLTRPRHPADLLACMVRDEPPRLEIDIAEGRICYRRMELDMNPAHLALYAWFARRKKDYCQRPKAEQCGRCRQCFVDAGQVVADSTALRRLYAGIKGSRLLEEMRGSGIAALDLENFRSYRSKINSSLRKAFGGNAADLLSIDPVGRRPDTRYGLKLDRNRIRMVF